MNFKMLKRKEIYDFDGFLTDYALYELDDGRFVCIFGDTDLYDPSNTEPDFETEDRTEAHEWFDNYTTDEDAYDDVMFENKLHSASDVSQGASLQEEKGSSIKVEKISSRTNDQGGTTTLYQVGDNYQLVVRTYGQEDDFEVDLGVVCELDNRFCPKIYAVTHGELTVQKFTVNTTSYGALNIQELDVLISNLTEASKVAKYLTDVFINKTEKLPE